ncbi:MAG: hypothetical protein HZB66_03265 [Candidatus Aenigmarchaeota archaeon]|nr:hypothetical protein [Candidatus Aenigmarchaeota archaeon]
MQETILEMQESAAAIAYWGFVDRGGKTLLSRWNGRETETDGISAPGSIRTAVRVHGKYPLSVNK